MNKKVQEVLKGKNLIGKYDAIESFLFSTFNVTNSALPNMTKANPIMAVIVLEELKELDVTIEKDIQSINLNDIDVIDITTNRKNELSRFIYNLLLTTNVYGYKRIEDDLRAYDKSQKLEKVYPISKRRERLEELKVEIEKVEDMVNAISEVDAVLGKSYSKKLSDLQREHEAIEETIYVKSIDVITEEAYSMVMARINGIREIVVGKVELLERVLGA